MKNYFLLEVGVEELPSRFVESTLTQIKENLEKSLKENRVEFENIEKYGTPRRLTFVINNICDKQSDLEEELKGPSKKISVDADGNFTKPALGFMKSKGLDEANVYFKQVGKDEYLFGTLKQEGQATSEVLKEIVPAAIKGVTFPKAMRWGGKNMRFARPIRWMVALLNDEVLPINLEGIVASNITRGHRFLGRNQIEVFSIEDYFKQLSKNSVVLDQNVRKEAIKAQAEEVAKSLGGEVEIEDDLLEEITGLLGGRTAEELVFGEITTGAHNDFEKATKIARAMVTEYGMSDLGPLQFEQQEGSVFLGRDYNKSHNFSNEVANEIDMEMRKIIDECHAKATEIIKQNMDLLKLIAESLLEQETLTKEEIDYLVANGHLPKDNQEVSGEKVEKVAKTKKKKDNTEK